MNSILKDTVVIIDPDFHFARHPINTSQEYDLKLLHSEKELPHAVGMLENRSPEFIVKRLPDNAKDDVRKTVSTIKELKQQTSSKIVLMNVKEEKRLLEQLIFLEINGIVDDTSYSMEEVLEKVKDYNFYLSTTYQTILCEKVKQKLPELPRTHNLVIDEKTALEYLTASEINILREILSVGGSNEAIANRLFLAPKTIKNYISSMMSKLDANNRTHLIARSIQKGIIQLE